MKTWILALLSNFAILGMGTTLVGQASLIALGSGVMALLTRVD